MICKMLINFIWVLVSVCCGFCSLKILWIKPYILKITVFSVKYFWPWGCLFIELNNYMTSNYLIFFPLNIFILEYVKFWYIYYSLSKVIDWVPTLCGICRFLKIFFFSIFLVWILAFWYFQFLWLKICDLSVIFIFRIASLSHLRS